MIKELIRKYFSVECSEKEKEAIEIFFLEHLEEIDKYFTEEEWDVYEQSRLPKSVQSEAFLENLYKDSLPKHSVSKIRKRLSVAAIWLLSMGMLAYLYTGKVNHPITYKNSTQSLLPKKTIQTNNSNKAININLPDYSKVSLSPASTIEYVRGFSSNKRDIYLSGEAIFHVYKDASRPFTVYCKGVATTALGTVFKVSDYLKKGSTAVILMEGKILVRSVIKNHLDSKRYYLLPGNEIDFDQERKEFSFIETQNQSTNYTKQNKDTHTIPSESKDIDMSMKMENAIQFGPSSIQFNDVNLSEALNVLAKKRGVKITYPTNRVSKIKFIGTIDNKEPTEKILSDIASMNDFSIQFDSSTNIYILQ